MTAGGYIFTVTDDVWKPPNKWELLPNYYENSLNGTIKTKGYLIYLGSFARIVTVTQIQATFIRNIRKIYNKDEMLYKVAKASTKHPKVEDVVFKAVEKATLLEVIEEHEHTTKLADYDSAKTAIMKSKYIHHYRRILKPLLDVLIFKATNPINQSIIDGLTLIKKYIDSKHTYYPEDENIPDKLLGGNWEQAIYKETPNGNRAVKHYFELCVLTHLATALKCKEVWVEGAYLYRNPDLDLPQDWEEKSVEYCLKQNIPIKPEDFIEPIKKELTECLTKANSYFSKKQEVYIYFPGRGEKKGCFRIPKIEKKEESLILQEIKNQVVQRWGVLDLLDILIEADRQVNFIQFFPTPAQREILNTFEKRKRLILSLFSLATNMGLKRIHAASQVTFSYDDLYYFSKRYIQIDSVRDAIRALTNRILTIRNSQIWGNSTTCASDGRYITTWDQNLLAEWNVHYQKCGVMAYWHLDTNNTCLYSQLKVPTSSQVVAMIKGLIHHDTEMRIEKNMVDSHGQSEVAFPFCRLIGVDLRPRLKRMKYSRLYLAEKGQGKHLKHLKGVHDRPIRWQEIYEQYSEMARHVVAALEKTGPIESILRRFNSNNRNHPTYKAFTEAGKALKTIHVCHYLTQACYRREIHEALNIVENWNSTNDFISYGRTSEIQSNDPQMQELAILCLHLLQNALILVNTLMVEKVLYEDGFIKRMTSRDFQALTPLFTMNINPYGNFLLNLDRPSFLGDI